ncbi:MAG: MFS transporter, partial [Gammaproteobacteria bacterium]|nr:MFS transporter [Gammaproteobacteria bacterium]
MTTGPVVNVDDILDRVRLQGLPLLVMICVMAVLILDGFDIQIIGFSAPALAQEFGIERKALGPVLAAALLGMAAGAFAGGLAGDRWGRRPTLIAGTAVVGAATFAAAMANSIESLTFWRLITGIGLGGTLPNATALMAEFAPRRWRSQAITATIVGVPVGGMIGAAIAAEIVPEQGWRLLFLIGAALPMLLAAIMYFLLPESARYLVTRADRHRELAALLGRIDPGRTASGAEAFVLSTPAGTESAGLGALFSRGLMRDTIAAWLVFGANVFAVYAFFNWIAVVLTSVGLDIATAVRAGLVFNLAGVIGSLANAWIIARFGSRWPLGLMAALAIASLLHLAQLPLGGADSAVLLPALMAGVAIAGLSITAVQIGMYAVCAHI